jgi:hypothetical protein
VRFLLFTGIVSLLAFGIVADAQTRQVTFNAQQAQFQPTVLTGLSDGGCLVTQCYGLDTASATSADCYTFQPTRLQTRNACLALIDLGQRRVLSRVFPVDGGDN